MKGIGMASAFRTLTVLPFPGKECGHLETTLYWFPLVGLVLGGLVFGMAWLLLPMGYPLLSGALVCCALAFLTRAFHLDGLADTADGFGGGWTKERRLEIMKDSHTGAFGVVAVVCVLLVKGIALGGMASESGLAWILTIPLLSRALIVFQTVVNPYARPQGGTAAALVNGAKVRHLLAIVMQVALFSWVISSHIPLIDMGIVLGVGLLMTSMVALTSRRMIGGVTGDVLGATCELSEAAMSVAAVIVLAI